MIFKFMNNDIDFIETSFIDDVKESVAVFSKIIVNKNVFPEDASSIDKIKQKSLIKSWSENYERREIGFDTFRKDSTWIISNNKLGYINRSESGYGMTKKYGFLDTTGTAAGQSSIILKNKSLSELIEKNEVMLFWYANKGNFVPNKGFALNKIMNLGLNSDDIFIFVCNELSNAYTSIVFYVKDNELISTGVNCSLNFRKAVENAIEEAKLLKDIYFGNKHDPIKDFKFTKREMNEIINIILKKSRKVIQDFSPKIQTEFNLIEWAKEVDYVGISINGDLNIKCIRCCSKSLLNCIPIKNNIYLNSKKYIIENYNILNKINDIPECPII